MMDSKCAPVVLAESKSYLPDLPKELPEKPTGKPSAAQWFVWILSAGVVVAVAGMTISHSKEGLGWLFAMKEVSPGQIGDIAKALMPLAALALAIERLVETFFDLFERAAARVANLGTAGLAGLTWIRDELDRAWNEAKAISGALNGSNVQPSDNGSKDQIEILKRLGLDEADYRTLLMELERAEQRIIAANNRIAGLRKDPQYVALKRSWSIWMGFLFGLIVAIVSDAGIFELLRIGVPRCFDMIVTGLVIGAGSGPMHSLVGALQGAKDSLQTLGLWGSFGLAKQRYQETPGGAGTNSPTSAGTL